MRIDQSRHKAYVRCPRAFEIRYVKNVIMPPSGALFLGSTVHHALDFLAQEIMSKKMVPSQDTLLDFFSTSFDKRDVYIQDEEAKATDLPDIDWTEEAAGPTKDLGINLLKKYHKARASLIKPVQAELYLERTLPNGDIYYGTLDRIDEDGTVYDYKTAKKRSYGLTYSQNNVDQDIQPTAYFFLLGGPGKWGFELLLKDPVECSLGFRETERSQEDIDWYIESMLMEDLKGIRAGFFPPRPGFLCENWCGYRQGFCKYRSTFVMTGEKE